MVARGQSRDPAMVPDARERALVAAKLSWAVRKSGLTLQGLASESGVSVSALSRYLSGERLVTTHALMSLCPVLEVSADWVLGTGRPPPSPPSILD